MYLSNIYNSGITSSSSSCVGILLPSDHNHDDDDDDDDDDDHIYNAVQKNKTSSINGSYIFRVWSYFSLLEFFSVHLIAICDQINIF